MSKYVVVDLEMCDIPKGAYRGNMRGRCETIQIGAVLLNESLEIVDTFISYVSPQYGIISKYIENLTHISPKDVKGAPDFCEVLTRFISWVPEDAIIVSWSDSDKMQIINEIDGKGFVVIGIDKYLETWVDCQKTFSDRMDTEKRYKLSEALSIADIYWDDGEHDALVDARNTAYLFAKMEREPVLQLSPYYIGKIEEKPSYNPFAELLLKYSFS